MDMNVILKKQEKGTNNTINVTAVKGIENNAKRNKRQGRTKENFTKYALSKKGTMALGGNFNIGLDHGYTNFGIGAKYSYNFIDHLRGEACFDYFFKKDYVSQWDINVNLHYVFEIKKKHGLYPLAGFTYIHLHAEYNGTTANVGNAGFNLGAGYEYRFSEHFKAGVEGKFQWADGGRGVISFGAAYMF